MKYIDRSPALLQTMLNYAPQGTNRYLLALGHFVLGSKLVFEGVRAKNITSLVTRAGWIVWGISNLLQAKEHLGPQLKKTEEPPLNKALFNRLWAWPLMFGLKTADIGFCVYTYPGWQKIFPLFILLPDARRPSETGIHLFLKEVDSYAKAPSFSAPSKIIASMVYSVYFDPFTPLLSYLAPAKANLLAKVRPSRYTSVPWPGNIIDDIKQALTPNIFK